MLLLLAGAVLLLLSACSAKTGSTANQKTAEVGAGMGGPQMTVHISPQAINTKPKPPDLSTPQSAVRSYLDWVSYAYRIGQSDVASPTMGPDENVRVDAYVQYNFQSKKLLDQQLMSVTFGKPSTGATSTTVPASEKWTYHYSSIEQGNKTLGGPYAASYDTVYTVIHTKSGWQVYSVKATPRGAVK